MKALIRNSGETVTEDMNISGIDWTTGAPLTNTAWCGGSYTLVADYVPPVDTCPETYTVPHTAAQTETVTDEGTVEGTGEATDEGTDENTTATTATVASDGASGATFTDDEGRTYTLDEIRQMIGLSD